MKEGSRNVASVCLSAGALCGGTWSGAPLLVTPKMC